MLKVNIKNNENKKDIIVVYCLSLAHLRMAKRLLSSMPDKKFLVLCERSDWIFSEFTGVYNENIIISSDSRLLFYGVKSYCLLIVFGALNHPGHDRVNFIVNFFKKTGVPTLDFQHGFIQWGVNFVDHSRVASFDNDCGVSLELNSNCDKLVKWFEGEDSVGYPFFSFREKKKINEENENVLILSNLNWHIYSDCDRSAFLSLVIELALDNPGKKFRWRPHPAEFAHNHVFMSFMDLSKSISNLEIVNPKSHDVSVDIEWADCSISTFSTVLVDLFCLKVPTLVYCHQDWFPGKDSIISASYIYDKKDAKRIFSCKESWGNLEVKNFKQFDVNEFEGVVSNLCKKLKFNDVDRVDFFSYYREYMSLFILNNKNDLSLLSNSVGKIENLMIKIDSFFNKIIASNFKKTSDLGVISEKSLDAGCSRLGEGVKSYDSKLLGSAELIVNKPSYRKLKKFFRDPKRFFMDSSLIKKLK